MLIKITCEETQNYLVYTPGEVKLVPGVAKDGGDTIEYTPGKVVDKLNNKDSEARYDKEIKIKKGENRLVSTEVEDGVVVIAVTVTTNKMGIPVLKASPERAVPKAKMRQVLEDVKKDFEVINVNDNKAQKKQKVGR